MNPNLKWIKNQSIILRGENENLFFDIESRAISDTFDYLCRIDSFQNN